MGLLIVIAAIAVVLWPLNSTGVTGNAIHPTYVPYGWASYSNTPLPAHPNKTQLRAAGIPVPSDAVNRRRHVSEALAVGGLVLAAGAIVVTRRGRNTPRHLAVA